MESDREREISYEIPYMLNLERNDTNELNYKTEIDSQASRMSLWLPGRKVRGRDSSGTCDGHVYAANFKMDNQQDLLIARGILPTVMWQPEWEGSLGGEWIHIYVRLNPFGVHPKLSQPC